MITGMKDNIDARIIKVLKKHHIFTLATSSNNLPYCCTCFYAYYSEGNEIIFTSEKDTRHISEALLQKHIAGNIALETKLIGIIRGIQFTGLISEISEKDREKYVKIYTHRFPYVKHLLKEAIFWKIEPDFFKLTDNKLGFGKKIIWNKNN